MNIMAKDHPSLLQLAARCRIAAVKLPIGSCWKHYRDGDIYEITGFTVDEASNQIKVVYRPIPTHFQQDRDGYTLYQLGEVSGDLDMLQFDRPHTEFFDMVEAASAPALVQRYERVRRSDCYLPY